MRISKQIQSIIVLIISAILLGFSVNLYIYAGLGSDSITVFEEGLHKSFHLSLGNASYIFALLSIGAGLIVGRKYMRWTSIAYALLCGPAIEIVRVLLDPLKLHSATLAIKMVMVCLAIFSTSLACAILIRNKNGVNSLDAIAIGLSERINMKYEYLRMSLDTILMIVGWLLGGTIGIGTIAAVLFTGVLIDRLS